MQSAQLDNCLYCGRLFVKEHSDCCLDCFKEIEIEFHVVSRFLKDEKNRAATVDWVSKCTDVPVKRIINFIRDGRIYAEDFPNLGYPCTYCGTLIKKQILCYSCFEGLSLEIEYSITKDGVGGNRQTAYQESQYWRLKQEK
jgi:flagellar operon protein (TIGR03826 family)